MDNLLKDLVEKAVETIIQANLSKCLPTVPGKDEVAGGMNEMFDNNKPKRPEGISDEKWEEYERKMKEKRNKLVKETGESLDEFKKTQEDSIKDAAKNNLNAVQEIKHDLDDLGTSAGLLIVGTAEFLSRVAMIPPAIISTTPVGPGVSPQLMPPMIKDLKAEGDNLSKIYDNCSSIMNKLGLENLENSLSSEERIDFGPVSSVVKVVKSAMSTAKPFILAVGASVGDESGSEPEVDPPIEISYNARDCSNFNYIVQPGEGQEGDISPSNCSRFEVLNEGNSDSSCDNCKHFNKRS